jgi:hypothetical protein
MSVNVWDVVSDLSTRWLKVNEVFDLLVNYQRYNIQLSNEVPSLPPSTNCRILYFVETLAIDFFLFRRR